MKERGTSIRFEFGDINLLEFSNLLLRLQEVWIKFYTPVALSGLNIEGNRGRILFESERFLELLLTDFRLDQRKNLFQC